MNGTHRLLVCAIEVDLMGKIVYSIKKGTKVLLFGSKYSGLEVDAEKLSIYSCDVNRRQEKLQPEDN